MVGRYSWVNSRPCFTLNSHLCNVSAALNDVLDWFTVLLSNKTYQCHMLIFKKVVLEFQRINSFLNISVNAMDHAIVKLDTNEFESCNKMFTDRQLGQVCIKSG